MGVNKKRSIQARHLIVALLALIAMLPAFQMWDWVSSTWVPLPYMDEWHTPASQFESWRRGTLTLAEMFSIHNESRKFFPRLLYFALERFGGWDVRKEICVGFLAVCALCFLLWHLLRRTPGATQLSTLMWWALMSFICFAPVQLENFLYGIQLEPFFPGLALMAAAAVNLSRLSLRARTLINLSLAFVATYTFANGMLVWLLAWPLILPNEHKFGAGRWIGPEFISLPRRSQSAVISLAIIDPLIIRHSLPSRRDFGTWRTILSSGSGIISPPISQVPWYSVSAR